MHRSFLTLFVYSPSFASPPQTFINRGLNTRPTFFGCSATTNVTNSGTAANNSKVPIVAYFPNYPYLDLANTSTFKLEYSAQESQGVIDNAVAVATLGGADSNWPTCLGCAIMQRSFERTGIQRPAECDSCMQRYCW